MMQNPPAAFLPRPSTTTILACLGTVGQVLADTNQVAANTLVITRQARAAEPMKVLV